MSPAGEDGSETRLPSQGTCEPITFYYPPRPIPPTNPPNPSPPTAEKVAVLQLEPKVFGTEVTEK